MLAQDQAAIEKISDDFSWELFFEIRTRTFEVLDRIAAQVHVGMLEEEANQIAIATLQAMGTRQGWHKPYVRFGANTTKSFGAPSDPGVQLQENDIYFIDIGPVWDNYEGDAGNTFVTGNDPDMKRCSEDVKQIFEIVAQRWRTEQCSGEVLYQFAEQTAQEKGWVLNLDLSGHRLGTFPHEVQYDGTLASLPFSPTAKHWVLEIQIRHPKKSFGAFYEDLLLL